MTDASSLARDIVDLQRRLADVERSDQLGRSSVRVNGTNMALADGLSTGVRAAARADRALTTANGKNTVTYSAGVATGSGKVKGDIWFRTDNSGTVIGSWLWDGEFWKPHEFGDEVLGSLTVGKLVTGEIAAGQRIIAGPENMVHAEMSSTGFRAFGPDLDGDGLPNEVVRLGTDTDDYFAVIDNAGLPAASIDGSGRAQFRALNLNEWPTINAYDATGGRGGSLLTILDNRARGIVGWGAVNGRAPGTDNSNGVGVFEIGVSLYGDRLYKIQTSPLRFDASGNNNVLIEVQVRQTYSASGTPANPTITSPIVARTHVHLGSGLAQSAMINKLTIKTTGNYRFLLSYHLVAGGGTVTLNATETDSAELWVEDIGPARPNLQSVNNGGGGMSATPPPVAPAPPPPPQTYTLNAEASWVRVFTNSGFRTDTTDAVQGYQASNGQQRSLIGFPDLTPYLAGSTVTSVAMFLQNNHWYYNAGGSLFIGRHGELNPPGGLPSARVEGMRREDNWGRGEGRWVDITPYAAQDWATGATRGILLGGNLGTDPAYYGRFDGTAGNRPKIAFYYTK